MKKIFLFFFVGLVVLTAFCSCLNTDKSQQQAQKQQIAQPKKETKPKEVNVKIDHSRQSADDVDNATTRAIEPEIVTGLKTLNPNYVQEVIVNVNMAGKATTVILDVLFMTDTLNKDKESVFVKIAKQLRKVKNLKKFTIWSFEEQMYNPDTSNQYMIVVYTKYLPKTSDFTFLRLVNSSNNGSINGVQYFNQNRK